jgi:hypothetical protein
MKLLDSETYLYTVVRQESNIVIGTQVPRPAMGCVTKHPTLKLVTQARSPLQVYLDSSLSDGAIDNRL